MELLALAYFDASAILAHSCCAILVARVLVMLLMAAATFVLL